MSSIYEYFPADLNIFVDSLWVLFDTFKDQLHKETWLKIIQVFFILLKKGFLDLIPTLDIILGTFELNDKNLREAVI